MTFELKKAVRQKAKLRIGLAGVSGSGKTYSALKLARGLASAWDKIAVIDTENGSADLYADLGDYNTLTLTAPFTPERYIEAIHQCEEAGMEVIIVDSITHVWKGKGGLLEFTDKLGGRFQDWAKTTPRYQAFVTAILESSAHVITAVRKKTAYSMSTTSEGKSKVEKQGLEDEIRDGFDYELTLSFNINLNHLASTSKDRTGLYMDRPEFVISEETGQELIEWSESGAEVVRPTPVVKQEPKQTQTKKPENNQTTKEETTSNRPSGKQIEAVAKVASYQKLIKNEEEAKELMEEVKNKWTRQEVSDYIGKKADLEDIRKKYRETQIVTEEKEQLINQEIEDAFSDADVVAA